MDGSSASCSVRNDLSKKQHFNLPFRKCCSRNCRSSNCAEKVDCADGRHSFQRIWKVYLCRKCNAKTNPLERRYCIHVKRDVYFDYWNVFGRAFEWTIDFWDACRCYNSSHRQIQSKRSCAYFITPLFDGLCNHRGFSANKNVGQ